MKFWFRDDTAPAIARDETFYVSAADGLVGIEMVADTAHVWAKMTTVSAEALVARINGAISAAKLMEVAADPETGTRTLNTVDQPTETSALNRKEVEDAKSN